VLCVEDEKVQLKLRKMLLESAGFDVLEAQSARSAMEIFRSSHVDAVVMDYWLSGQNGTALAEEMKGMRPRIPIVMLSGFTSLPGEEAIVDTWMRKAEVEPEDLINEITKLIALRGGSRQAENS
jgi:DNA-binding NtrC family response regulator